MKNQLRVPGRIAASPQGPEPRLGEALVAAGLPEAPERRTDALLEAMRRYREQYPSIEHQTIVEDSFRFLLSQLGRRATDRNYADRRQVPRG